MAEVQSSRDSAAGAGWGECSPGSYRDLMAQCGRTSRRGDSIRDRRFSWLSPVPIWQSRNQVIAPILGDPTNARRRKWMEALGRSAEDDLLVDHSGRETLSFLLAGDTGEGDASQYAVVPPLLTKAADTSFLFLCSDVIYPAGGIEEYEGKVWCPYRGYDGTIHAIPGNHDWYDDGAAFMHAFCGATAQRPKAGLSVDPRSWLRALLWRRAPRGTADPRPATQPAPYFAIDAGPLRLLAIDTGMTGEIDRDQAAWLRRMSQGDRPKLLLTGKPLFVDADHRPGSIEGGGTIDEIVTNAAYNYIGAVGGDIHNYQRYLVDVGEGRRLAYIVSGGGGAFMHQTHTMPNLDTVEKLQGKVSEADMRCYPLRGDSLARYSQLYGHKFRRVGGRKLVIPEKEARLIVAERIGVTPTRPVAGDVEVSDRSRRAAKVLFKLPARGRGPLHLPFSEWLDWNEPPMFKHFLRFDVAPEEVRIQCFAVSGCGDAETQPPREDHLLARRGDDGRWAWSVVAEDG